MSLFLHFSEKIEGLVGRVGELLERVRKKDAQVSAEPYLFCLGVVG